MKNVLKEYISLLIEKNRYKREKKELPSKLSVLDKYKDDPYVLVHFSDLNKLGINPKTSYDTPAGIYGYNLKVLYKDIINNDLNFASDRKFMHIFRIKSEYQSSTVIVDGKGCDAGNEELWMNKLEILKKTDNLKNTEFSKCKQEIINTYEEIIVFVENIIFKTDKKDKEIVDLYYQFFSIFKILEKLLDETYLENLYTETKIELDKLFNKLDSTIHDIIFYIVKNLNIDNVSFKDFLEDSLKSIKSEYSDLENLIQDKFKKFELDDENLVNPNDLKDTWFKTSFGYFFNACRLIGKNTLGWNRVLRQQGISAVIDNGCGMIHKNEPAQGVVLSGKFIEQLETIEDPYSKEKDLYNDKEDFEYLKAKSFVKKINSMNASQIEKKFNSKFFDKNYEIIAERLNNYFSTIHHADDSLISFMFLNKNFVLRTIKENKYKHLVEKLYMYISSNYGHEELTVKERKTLLLGNFHSFSNIKKYIDESIIFCLLNNKFIYKNDEIDRYSIIEIIQTILNTGKYYEELETKIETEGSSYFKKIWDQSFKK